MKVKEEEDERECLRSWGEKKREVGENPIEISVENREFIRE